MQSPSAVQSLNAIQACSAIQACNLITRIPVQLGEGGEVTQVYYTLDGSTSYIQSDFDPSAIGTGDISISCWLRVDTVPSGTQYIWILGNDNLDNSLSLRIRSTKLEVFGRVGTEDEIEVTAANTIVPDLWTHVVVTRTGTTIELFVNGTSNASGTNSEAAANLSDGETWIGYHIGSSSFAGDFANFEIRNAVLTDSEIYDNFNAGTAYTTGTEQTQTLTPTNTTETNSSLPASWNNRWAFYGDGVNDHISLDSLVSSISSDTTGTISFWVKVADATATEAFFSVSDFSALTTLWCFFLNGIIYFRHRDAGTDNWRVGTDSAVISTDTWTKIDLVHDGVEPIIYVDGAKPAQSFDITLDKTAWLNDLTTPDVFTLFVIKANGAYANYFHGLIDEFHYTSDALTSGQIATQYNAGTPADPRSLSLDGYIHEATGADWSGNNNLATLQSGAEITTDVPVITLPAWENSHSLDFNGSSAYVYNESIIPAIELDTVGTFSFWIKPDLGTVTTRALIAVTPQSSVSDYLRISAYGLEIAVALRVANSWKFTLNTDSDVLTLGVWSHVCVVQDGVAVKIYIDGSEVAQTFGVSTDTGAWMNNLVNPTLLNIAKLNDASTQYFDGHIAHFGYIQTNIDAAAITKLASEPIDLTSDDGDYDNSSDLVAYWPFISGAGAGALDHSGNSNHGTIIDANWTTDVPIVTPITNTYSIDLNGTNQYMEANALASVVSSDNVGSFSAWIAPTDASPNNAKTIMGFGDANADSKLEIHITGITQTLVRVSCSIAGTIQWLLSSSDLGWTNGVWHHVTVTHDGSTAKLYIDGVDISAIYTVTTDKTAWLTDITGIDTFCVGATNKNSAVTQYFDGLIDEAAYFSTELSAAQVTAIYNSGVPANLAPYSPVGWYRMGDNDGGTGTTITDQGSGGNDGTLTNAPTFSTNVPT